jgi:hypothetical protein
MFGDFIFGKYAIGYTHFNYNTKTFNALFSKLSIYIVCVYAQTIAKKKGQKFYLAKWFF